MEMVDQMDSDCDTAGFGLWLTLQIGSSVSMFAEPRSSTPLEYIEHRQSNLGAIHIHAILSQSSVTVLC